MSRGVNPRGSRGGKEGERRGRRVACPVSGVSNKGALPAVPASPPLPLTLLFIAPQLVLHRIDERLPRSLDDVVGDAHGAPRVISIARRDQDPGARRRRLRLV